jgi:hypothetical protein
VFNCLRVSFVAVTSTQDSASSRLLPGSSLFEVSPPLLAFCIPFVLTFMLQFNHNIACICYIATLLFMTQPV